MWQHNHLCSVFNHRFRRLHLWIQIWEEEASNPSEVKKRNPIIDGGLNVLLQDRFQTDAKVNLPSLSLCRNYAIMVTMFFTVSVINNYALNFNISLPLHMIFRSVRAVVRLLFLLSRNLRPSPPPRSDLISLLFVCRDRWSQTWSWE